MASRTDLAADPLSQRQQGLPLLGSGLRQPAGAVLGVQNVRTAGTDGRLTVPTEETQRLTCGNGGHVEYWFIGVRSLTFSG